MRVIQKKQIWKLFWVQSPLKIVPMDNEDGISIMHQSIDPFCKTFSRLLLELLHHHGLGIFDRSKHAKVSFEEAKKFHLKNLHILLTI
jgi:hypothetical protein